MILLVPHSLAGTTLFFGLTRIVDVLVSKSAYKKKTFIEYCILMAILLDGGHKSKGIFEVLTALHIP